MPLFEFTCPMCGLTDEYYQPHLQPQLCPCGRGIMKLLVSAPALISIRGYSQFNSYSRNKVPVRVPGHERMKVTVESK